MKIDKDYNFYVTDQNNVYSELAYQLTADTYEITIDFNLAFATR